MSHVTIAAGLSVAQSAEAISALVPLFAPTTLRPATVKVVSFPPADIRWTKSLGIQ